MGQRWRRRVRHGAVGVVVWSFVVGATVASAPSPGTATPRPGRPDWVTQLGARSGPGPEPVPWEESSTRALPRPGAGDREAAPLAEPELPEPEGWTVALGDEGEAAERVAGDEGPVAISAAADGFAGEQLDVEVLEPAAAERAGVSGFVFGVSETAADLPAEVAVDYSGLATAYGGGYADRLQVVALPDCAVADPVPPGCSTGGVELPTRNDRDAESLIVEVDDLGSVGLLAVTADVGGEEGSYAATPVSQTGQWQVAQGSGEFNYTYDIDVPPPAGGTAPSLAMSYSSGAVDGLTTASNTQAPPTGLGWSTFGGFIERRYEPCVRTLNVEDLCWLNHNGTISLGGVSGALLPLDATNTQWAVHSDAGWRVERLTGANNGEGGVPGADGTGEHWKVTSTDGTQYFFGLGQNPDSGEATNSVGRVPVLADHSIDPCWGNLGNPNGFGMCDNQGYRWNLDRVVDPDGNVTTFVYDRGSNRYAAVNGLFNGRVYDRSTELTRIDYGAHTGPATADRLAATVRVDFARPYRCVTLADDCPMPTGGNGLAFPDVPSDLICGDSSCTAHAPSFFVTGRYASIKTSVLVGSQWKPVTQYNLRHSFRRGPIAGTPQKLYLDRIQQVGLADPSQPLGVPLPDTVFDFTWLPNRVDVNEAEGRKPMHHARVSRVTGQLGARIDVTYGQNRPCTATYRPAVWHDNKRDCFPQIIIDRGTRRAGVFNKYLVTQVTETASPTVTTPMTTTYAYEDDPAWAFNYGSFAQYENEWGWSNWRGYATTLVSQGSSRTRSRVFRGVDGDPLWIDAGGGQFCTCGRRNESLPSLTDPSRTFTDHPALAGRTLEEVQLGTVGATSNTPVEATMYEYLHRQTHAPGSGQLRGTAWAGLSAVTEAIATSPWQFRRQRTTTSYSESHLPVPQAVSSLEEGWLDVTGDERCSRTTYADNAGRWMFEYPASNVTVAGGCSSSNVVSASETYYDGSTTLGAAPTRGNPTRERTQLDGTAWATTTTEYDTLGRPVRATDPNTAATTTTYVASPSHAIPTETRVTNALQHTATTQWLPEYQVPTREVDANGNVTTYRYDGLGRLTNVALPTEQQAGMLEFFPSWQFAYTVDQPSGRATVRSRQMTSFQPASGGGTATYEDTWAIYDGLGREWQSQQQSPESGKVLVSETAYDDRGLVLHQSQPQAVSGTPGALALVPSWGNRTRNAYDELARQVRQEWMRGNQVVRTTQTAYGPDTVTVTGPDGNRARETTDGLGRTVAAAEHDGTNWVSSSYGYDLADNLTSVTDPAGNRTTYTYDRAGRRLTESDPNRGSGSFAYDAAGNQTRATDALGNVVHTVYDPLGRAVERHSGSATGPLLARWEYDTIGRGLLHRTTSFTSSGNWVNEVTGYDQRSRPAGIRTTVPAGIAGLSGSYAVSQVYDRADRVTAATYPAMGGLPQETVTTSYDSLGLATGLSSPLAQYVRSTTYDNRGRLTGAALGPAASGGGAWMARNWSFDADQRLAATQTFVAGSGAPSGIVARHEIGYDEAGNVSQRTSSFDGQSWRECYEHDVRQRLVHAFTVASSAACASGDPGTGDQPYEQRFTYSPDGRIQSRSEVVDPATGDFVNYTYPASGQPRPHAPTSIGTASASDTYAWDANGNMTRRTVGGRTETFTWDVQQRLASVQAPAPTGTTSFVYDADGQRVLRRTGSATTLYLAGHEITVNGSGAVTEALRSYAFEGQMVATRNLSGVSYLATDEAGSVEMGIPSGSQPNAKRLYEPYGQVRDEEGDLATDRGFLGEVEDPSTDLSHLQNRYYDATTGVFLSADPLYDTGNVKSLNPYTYGSGNPTTFSDPSGLSPTYIHGLEVQNRALKDQNRQLRTHIRRLGNHIEDLQQVIRRQNRVINNLVTRIRAMERIILQQQSIIRRLVARVNYLTRVVNYQRVVIGRLQAKIAYQQRIIAWQAGVIRYQRGVIVQLVGLAYLPAYRAPVLASIFAGRGIPFTYGTYRNLAASLQARIDALMASMPRGGGGGGGGAGGGGGGGGGGGFDGGSSRFRVIARGGGIALDCCGRPGWLQDERAQSGALGNLAGNVGSGVGSILARYNPAALWLYANWGVDVRSGSTCDDVETIDDWYGAIPGVGDFTQVGPAFCAGYHYGGGG